jgi:uncharacterized protein with HEPN domain
MSRVLKNASAIQFSNSRRIVDTRNRIIHGNDIVSDEIIWSIVTNHLPTLRQEVERLLSRADKPQ